jgi:outer membrane protein
MVSVWKSGARLAVAAVALIAMRAGAMAADLPATKDVVLAPIEDPRWYVRAGAAGIFYSGSANLNAVGVRVPGATATIPNNVTALFEGGYFILPYLTVQATAGIPPTATLDAAGIISNYGVLGKTTYAPAVLSVNYVYRNLGAFQPYVGVGAVYGIIFRSYDGAVHHLNVNSNVGFAVQGGAEYRIDRNWGVYIDAKHIWLSVNANGLLEGVVPLQGRVTVDPTVVSGGIAYHW